MLVTRHLRITGRVQGVGFRDALRSRALELSLRGWVRNRRDGSVEAVAQGEAADVESLLAWTRRGPPAARVADVSDHPAQDEFLKTYSRFGWLPTE